MKTIKLFALLAVVLLCATPARSQRDTAMVTFVLKTTGDSMRTATACLIVNGSHRFCRMATQDGTFTFLVPDSLRPSSLKLVGSNGGFRPMEWNAHINFLGTRHIDLGVTRSSQLMVAQWPLLEFSSLADPMQVDVDNGESTGYTTYNVTVEPNKAHHISWKRDNRVICDTSMNLGPGQRMKLSCRSSGSIQRN